MFNFILARLKERSTWVGIVTIITAAGVTISPEQIEAIAGAGTAIVGAILTFTADAANK